MENPVVNNKTTKTVVVKSGNIPDTKPLLHVRTGGAGGAGTKAHVSRIPSEEKPLQAEKKQSQKMNAERSAPSYTGELFPGAGKEPEGGGRLGINVLVAGEADNGGDSGTEQSALLNERSSFTCDTALRSSAAKESNEACWPTSPMNSIFSPTRAQSAQRAKRLL